jgi:hypothetical protein
MQINWNYMGDALPAFITIIVMPFTYSIAYGLIAGIISYIIMNTIAWIMELASGRRIVPPDKEFKEPWTWKIQGGLLPLWIVRAMRGYVFDTVVRNVANTFLERRTFGMRTSWLALRIQLLQMMMGQKCLRCQLRLKLQELRLMATGMRSCRRDP